MFDARVDVGQFIMQMNPNHPKFKKKNNKKNPTIWIMAKKTAKTSIMIVALALCE